MQIDPSAVSARDFYGRLLSCIGPRPIAWVSTVSSDGIPNLAPFSFFTGISAKPPLLCFSPIAKAGGEKKDTLRNLEATGAFVVHSVPFSLREKMNRTSAEFPYGVNEFVEAGLTAVPSVKIRPPSVGEAPSRMECVVERIVPLSDKVNLAIGRIVFMEISDTVLDDGGAVDLRKMDLIGRMGGDWYDHATDLFEMPRPPVPSEKRDAHGSGL
jgi:flavin reductase (DIM6/NTAB) family NADH-FMN oxidoreductase RutF